MVTNSPHLLKGQNTTDNIIYTDRGSYQLKKFVFPIFVMEFKLPLARPPSNCN